MPIGDEDYLRNLSEVRVKITDLGVGSLYIMFIYCDHWLSDGSVLLSLACWANKISEHIADIIQSPALRAPEVEIGAGWDESCDTWSMGCNVCLNQSRGLRR